MVAVKTGLAPPPMMPNQPMNMMPPPMPVPALNQPMPMQQGAAPVPVNARRRKRFGDSLETMLSRPPMVASDQMGDMNVFTGQMMNTTARPPVVRMRGGGNVGDMYKKAYSSPAFTSYTSSKAFSRPSNVRSTGSMTHSDLMASIRGGSSPNDDKPVVTAPVVPMNFGDDEDYTPTSAELNEAMKDMAAIGMPDMRSDTSAVEMPIFPDARDQLQQIMNDAQAGAAMESRFNNPLSPDSGTILAPGTGGLSSVPSIPSGTSSTLAQNMITFPQSPDTSMQPGPAYLPSDPSYVGSGMNPLTAYGGMSYPESEDAFLGVGPIDLTDPRGDEANVMTNYLTDPITDPIDEGLGKSLRPRVRPQGGGQTDTSSGEEDDRGFVEKFKDDVKQFIEMGKKDAAMAIAAGLFGSRATRFDRLIKAGYTKDEANSFLDRSEQTMKDMMKKQAQQSAQDDDGPMSTSPVDPCPPGMKLDPVSRICVPIEEAEEGPSYDLNRSRDDEFNELDDIMKKIVKPVGDTDDVRTMQAGGAVGLNRVADNFLAAMGG